MVDNAGSSAALQAPRTRELDPRTVTGVILAVSAVTAVLGAAVLAWPEVTLTVLAVLLAIQLMVAGIAHVVEACVTDERTFGSRTLLALAGALSLLVGLLVLRSPLQTVAIIALVVGALLVVLGVLRVIDALTARHGPRWWGLLGGLLTLLAGAFLLTQPELSLTALVSVVGLWMLASGLIGVVAALALRRDLPARGPAPDGTAAARNPGTSVEGLLG